jgi:hypothetical protein
MRTLCLDAGDAAELAELLRFLHGWLAIDGTLLAASLSRFVGIAPTTSASFATTSTASLSSWEPTTATFCSLLTLGNTAQAGWFSVNCFPTRGNKVGRVTVRKWIQRWCAMAERIEVEGAAGERVEFDGSTLTFSWRAPDDPLFNIAGDIPGTGESVTTVPMRFVTSVSISRARRIREARGQSARCSLSVTFVGGCASTRFHYEQAPAFDRLHGAVRAALIKQS